MLSPQITRLFSGKDFEPSILTMRITVLLILFIGFGNLTSIQILMPLGKERQILISVILGAIVDLGLNILLIPKYQQNGAAIANCSAEFVVTFTQLIFIRGLIKTRIFSWKSLDYLIGSSLIAIVTGSVIMLNLSNILTVIISIIASGLIYVTYCVLRKEQITLEILSKLKIV